MKPLDLICVTGPTASGKTAFAAHLAYCINGEIISADSRQVYRKMDIGTGKDYQDYVVNNLPVPYHLIDRHDPGYHYNLYEFQKDFLTSFTGIRQRNKFPLLVGGTGLYIQAVLEGYELAEVPVNPELRKELENKNQQELVKMLEALHPRLHNTTDTLNKKRTIRAIEIAMYGQADFQKMPKPESLVMGIKSDPAIRRKRISERLQARLKGGLVEEVEVLMKKISPEELMYYGLEYKYITLYLTGQITLKDMVSKLETAIHQFAKRQMTWFRHMERMGHFIHWLEAETPMDQKLERVFALLKERGLQNLIRQKC